MFAWPSHPVLHRRVRRIFWGGAALAVLVGALLATLAAPPRPRLLWNASASAPVGLYGVRPVTALRRGDMVVARMPAAMRGLAARRGYLPAAVPLVKRVAAIPGDRVCALGGGIYRNGRRLASRRALDARGRALPRWHGCVTLRGGTLLLLMADAPQSFDGRYFGPSKATDVIGEAIPLWVA